MGHGTVADEVKGRAPHGGRAPGRDRSRSRRTACASAPTSTAPSASWRPRRRWRSRPRWAPTSRSSSTSARRSTSPRDYTARSTERTHRWLRRCLDWHDEHGPDGQLVYGIVQGGVFEDLRVESAQAVAASECDGHRDRRLARRREGADVRGRRLDDGGAAGGPPAPPARHRRDRRPRRAASSSGIDTFDCAMPTRLGRHGMALVPDPERRWRVDLSQARWQDSRRAADGGLPVPGVRAGPHARLPALPGPRPRAHRRCACSRCTTSRSSSA